MRYQIFTGESRATLHYERTYRDANEAICAADNLRLNNPLLIAEVRQHPDDKVQGGFVIENDVAIWGVGDNPESAWAYMEREVDTTHENYSREDFHCCRATAELIVKVRTDGGAIGWGKLTDGTRCTVAQEEAELNRMGGAHP